MLGGKPKNRLLEKRVPFLTKATPRKKTETSRMCAKHAKSQ
jgi:hypothetical protein